MRSWRNGRRADRKKAEPVDTNLVEYSIQQHFFLNKKSCRFDSGEVQMAQVKHDQPVEFLDYFSKNLMVNFLTSNQKQQVQILQNKTNPVEL